jgi:hypothetical protein
MRRAPALRAVRFGTMRLAPIGAMACYVPALRAANSDPLRV